MFDMGLAAWNKTCDDDDDDDVSEYISIVVSQIITKFSECVV